MKLTPKIDATLNASVPSANMLIRENDSLMAHKIYLEIKMKTILIAGLLLVMSAILMGCKPFDLPTTLFKSIFANNASAIMKMSLSPRQVNQRNKKGQTPLMIAAYVGNVDIIDKLIHSGASVDARDSANSTALMYAAVTGQSEILKLLIKKGAKINAMNNKKQTALMLAAQAGQKHCLRILLDEKASFSDRDIFGYNAYDYARRFSQSSSAEFLSVYATKHRITLDRRGWYVQH